nr:uncharacterized protein LOC127347139 [Lolium perenne]
MRETHYAAGLRTTGTSTSHAATTPHHVGPPTSPPAGAEARRNEQPTTTCRSPPAEEEAGERGRHPAHPRRTAAVSRRRRCHIWEEPELRPPPRCFEPPGVQMGRRARPPTDDPEQARAGPQEPIRARRRAAKPHRTPLHHLPPRPRPDHGPPAARSPAGAQPPAHRARRTSPRPGELLLARGRGRGRECHAATFPGGARGFAGPPPAAAKRGRGEEGREVAAAGFRAARGERRGDTAGWMATLPSTARRLW